MKNFMLKNKQICSLLAALSCGFIAYAQPGHDNPCGAIVLPVVESADPPAENRVSFNGATYTAYSISGTGNCGISFSFPTNPDVWYRFVATQTQLRVAISPAQGGNPGCNVFYGNSAAEFLVLTGNCSGPFTQVACGRSDIASSNLLSNLVVGNTYYIKISSGFGYTCGTLSCAVYTGFPPSTARMGINTSQPQSNLDVAGNAFFRNRVGIGVNNPVADLHVAGSIRLNNGTEGNGKVLTSNADGLATWQNAASAWVINGNHISNSNSGNVGIGQSNPNAPLQFANDLGSRKIVLYEGANNDHQFYGLGINSGIFRYQLDAQNASHVFYAATGSSASTELFRISGGGNVGIGQSNPTAPLQFANDTRNRKIVLWSNQNNDHEFYGFGVNGGLLRYQTNSSSDDHVFYAGLSATTSRELLRIKGNGLVGIGANDPQYRLDVDNRIRVRSGGDNNNSAGIWLNRTDNTALQSFLGINQGNVGFYGVPFGWGLEMNTTTGNVGIGNSAPNAPLQFAADTRNRKIVLWQTTNNDHQFYGFGVNGFTLRYQTGATTDDHVFFAGTGANTSNELFRIKGNGALGINGNTGQPGQVLRSNGNNAAASWMDSEFDRTILISGNGNTLTDGDGQIGGVVPGLSHTFTLAGNAKVLVQFNISATALPCAFCGNSFTWVDIRINGTRAAWFRNNIANNNTSMVTGSQLLQLGAGTHTLTIFADASGPDVQFGGPTFTNNMIVQIIPQ